RHCVSHLGAYVAGRLAPRDLAKVDQHLAGCEGCRTKHDELEEVGSGLRRAALPVPLILGPAAVASWKAATGSLVASAASASKASLADVAGNLIPVLQRPLLVAASGVFALGVISATVVGDPDGALRGGSLRVPVAITPTTAPPTDDVDDTPAADPAIAEPRFTVPADFALPPTTTTDAPEPEGSAGDLTTNTPPSSTPPSTPPAPKPLVATGTGLTLGPVKAAVSVGLGDGACTGASVNGTTVGCAPKSAGPGGTAGVTVSSEGTLIGPLDGRTTTIGL
ncbi:MAG: zf-HC2 domain-containing protein, partial [Acidimicrobiales bacterium]